MTRIRATIELRGETTVELEVDSDEVSDFDILDAAYTQTVLPSIGSDYGDVRSWEVISEGS